MKTKQQDKEDRERREPARQLIWAVHLLWERPTVEASALQNLHGGGGLCVPVLLGCFWTLPVLCLTPQPTALTLSFSPALFLLLPELCTRRVSIGGCGHAWNFPHPLHCSTAEKVSAAEGTEPGTGEPWVWKSLCIIVTLSPPPLLGLRKLVVFASWCRAEG